MALDFQQVREQVKQLGENAPEREQQLKDLREKAETLLHSNANNIEGLRKKVERAAEQANNLRCAYPISEKLTFNFPAPQMPKKGTIIAADGSQINPDRHSEVEYCLVNVGAISMNIGDTQAPQPQVESKLFYDDELYTETGMLTEGIIALIRDQREREVLADLAESALAPVVTLTDGPIEIWGREDLETSKRFDMYLAALSRLQKLGAITAGYVDRPRSDLVVRLLELASLEDNKLEEAGKKRWLRGIRDTQLFGTLLGAGERSAVFGIQSKSSNKYADELALRFFYLNVSREDDAPNLVRVEIPAWVADNQGYIDGLHAILIQQCQVVGSVSFPYIIHRAHETALVSFKEKELVTQMIINELSKYRIPYFGVSAKQRQKNLSNQKGDR